MSTGQEGSGAREEGNAESPIGNPTSEIRNSEYCLGPVDQIPLGEGREFRVAGHAVAVFRTRGAGVYATQAACPHRAGPLSDGLLGGTTLVCPLHAWKFDLETGQPLYGDCTLTTYPVRLDREDRILLTLSPSADEACYTDRD